MSGLAGTVFAILVFIRDPSVRSGQRGMLLAAAALLSVAFILAPFVRRAFSAPPRVPPTKTRRVTLLDEMRESASSEEREPAPPDAGAQPASALMSRLLIALYAVFAAILATVLWSMS
jgi:hypothetical protein